MSKTNQPPIVLASASPRRRRIFEALGIPHTVCSADADEKSVVAASPREFALKAALLKVSSIGSGLADGTLVVAADTIVVLNNTIFFKPADRDDAIRMLGELSGQTHQVISGIAVYEVGHATQLDAETTGVHVRTLTSDEIVAYVNTGEPMDKAGAYGIQGLGGTLVERIIGDYYNVVGLPLAKLLNMLEAHVDVSEYRERARQITPDIFKGI